MAPLPGSKTIPTGWSRHHVAAATGGMNSTVTVGAKDGSPVYQPPPIDDTVQAWTDQYSGQSRIQARNSADNGDVANQNLSGRSYLVQLEFKASGITNGMRVKVLTAINDVDLVGQDLWVIDPQLGSERFTRDLICSDNQMDVPSV